MRAPARFRELLLAAVSTALPPLLLLAAEGTLRLAHPSYLADLPQSDLARLHRYSEAYGWEPRPGAVAFVDGQRTTINAAGLRGALHPRERTQGRPRLLMLGDSVAFGFGVSDDETFSADLEGDGYEVVNLAVPGYGTDQALLRLEAEGAVYRPDLVVLHFCLQNDFVDNASSTYFYDGLHPKPYFTLERGALVPHVGHLRLPPVARAGLWLHEHSFLFNRVLGRGAAAPADWAERRAQALDDTMAVRDLTVRLIARAGEVARAQGSGFALMVHPSRRSFREGSSWLAFLRDAPELRGVTQVDMGERARADGFGLEELTLDPIGHLNASGHRETASVIERTIVPALVAPPASHVASR
ncbi:MAG: SGNH/GDSL hydrolase family protein [Vicinamibacteria bacterium]